MSKLFLANTSFELELENPSLDLKTIFQKHPNFLQLQFLPVLFAKEKDYVVVTAYPPDEYLLSLEKRGFKVFREPVGEWKFLDKFYKNPKKYALALQLEILVSFTKYAFTEDLVFTERCPQVSHYVFAKNAICQGYAYR